MAADAAQAAQYQQQMAAMQAAQQAYLLQQQQAAAGGQQAQQQQGQATQAQLAAYQQQLAAYQQAQQKQLMMAQAQGGAQAGQAGQAQAAQAQAAQLQAAQAQQAAAMQAARAAQAQQAGQGGQSAGGSRFEQTLTVTGCAHATVGPIIRGTFILSGENHGKPTYKKQEQVNGLDVMTYFWDERDGAGFSGWWFGPKVGGDQVWAYHADKASVGPPQTGWKVPYDGPVDETMAMSPPRGAAAAPTQQQQMQQAMMLQAQQARMQQAGGAQGAQSQEQARLQQQRNQLEQLKQRQQEEQKKRLEENRLKLEQANKVRMETQQSKMAELKAMQEQQSKLRAEEQARRLEEQKKKFEADKAMQQERMAEMKRQQEELLRKRQEEQQKRLEECRKKAEEQTKMRQEMMAKAMEEKRLAEEKEKARLEEIERKKREAAQAEVDKHMVVFTKYDADKDGKLSRKEIQNYAKGEFSFPIPLESLDRICAALIEEGSKGVSKEEFHRVRAAVGLSREVAVDAKRREEREEKEREAAKKKEQMQERCNAAKAVVDSAEEALKKAEAEITPAQSEKLAAMNAADMLAASEEMNAAATEAKGCITGAKEKVATLNDDVEDNLKDFVAVEIRKLESQIRVLEARAGKVGAHASKVKSDSVKKDQAELEKIRGTVLEIIKHHQVTKGLDNKGMFGEVNAKKDGKIMEGEFVKFLGTCEKKSDENGPVHEVPSEDEISRVFEHLDYAREGYLSEEKFISIIRQYMKVAKATVITEEIGIKSATIRRIEIGEVVEIIEGPTKDEDSGVERAKIKAMSDGVEGWVAQVGNEGTVFLKAGGHVFKVQKETILTPSFVIDNDKDETRKLKDSTRKLKVGELVEVKEWAKKEETSGLMRMQVRVKSDGQVGWATSVGNTGIVFLEVV